MDNRDNNSPDMGPQTEEKKSMVSKVTQEEIFAEIFSCAVWVAYALYILYRLEWTSWWDTFSYLPFIMMVASYILQKLVTVLYVEMHLKERKIMELYFSELDKYRNGEKNGDE